VPGPSRSAYTKEFREDAVRLYRSSGKSILSAPKSWASPASRCASGVKQIDLDSGARSDGLTSEERDELRRLRRENRVLLEEREILKKAAAFFAQETGGRTR
jgi:transposase